MADFIQSYERTMGNEGGYKLTDIPGDSGGQTYAGIARRFHPNWPGWAYIDRKEIPPTAMVRTFYRDSFWVPIGGDQIADQHIAHTIYDFGVNADPRVAVKLAQVVIGVTPDGSAGPVTLAALNRADPTTFHMAYALAKIKRYMDIVNRNRTQSKFLAGWINRVMKELA